MQSVIENSRKARTGVLHEKHQMLLSIQDKFQKLIEQETLVNSNAFLTTPHARFFR